MKVGITGAGGYVGSHLVASIAQRGHEVVPLSRDRGFRLGEPPSAELLAGLDAVIHTAYDFSARGWTEIERVNVGGSLALLDAATASGVSHFVFVSSLAAYEGCRSLYGRGKVKVEAEVLRRGESVVRPGTIFGGKGGGLFQSVSNLVAKVPVIPLPDRGDQTLYLIHIDDLCEILEMMIRLPLPDGQRLVTAACPEGMKFHEILRQLAQAGIKKALLPGPIGPDAAAFAGRRGCRRSKIAGPRRFASQSLEPQSFTEFQPSGAALRHAIPGFRVSGAGWVNPSDYVPRSGAIRQSR